MMTLHTQEQIAERAQKIYLGSGCKPGRDLENWLQAEAEINREIAGPTDCPVAATAKRVIASPFDARTKPAPRRKTAKRA